MASQNKKNYKSELLNSLIDTNSIAYKKTKARMLLALRIKEQMQKLGISNTELANKLGKNKSVITKWISGTHNFTTETLVEIEEILNLKLLNLKDKSGLVSPNYTINIKINPAESAKTALPITPQASLNDYPVINGDC